MVAGSISIKPMVVKRAAAPPKIQLLREPIYTSDHVITDLRACPPIYSHHRRGKYLHVSDLTKCIRRIAISEKFGIPLKPERLSDSQEMTFSQGRALGDFVVERFKAGHSGRLYGNWRCPCKRSVAIACTLDQARKTCKYCGCPVDIYEELSIADQEYMVVGNIDVVMKYESGHLYPIELKSMAHDNWKELARPIPAHVLQVVMYWHMLQRANMPLVNQTSILYLTKSMVFKGLPYKEFTIRPMDHVDRLSDMIADAKVRKQSMEGGKLPPRVFCSTPQVTEAKNCEMCQICFQEK